MSCLSNTLKAISIIVLMILISLWFSIFMIGMFISMFINALREIDTDCYLNRGNYDESYCNAVSRFRNAFYVLFREIDLHRSKFMLSFE